MKVEIKPYNPELFDDLFYISIDDNQALMDYTGRFIRTFNSYIDAEFVADIIKEKGKLNYIFKGFKGKDSELK